MDIIFDEISQYVIKKIDEQIMIKNSGKYFVLKKNSKYICCYYNDLSKLNVIQYCGYFDSVVYYYLELNNLVSSGYKFSSTKCNSKSFVMIGEHYDYTFMNYSKKIFYEVEDTFSIFTMGFIYSMIIENLKLCSIEYSHIKLNMDISKKKNMIDKPNAIIYDVEYEDFVFMIKN